jgi:hypothetical protein
MNPATDANTVSHLRQLLGPAVLLPWAARSKGERRKWKHIQLADMKDDNHLAKLEKAGNIGVALGKVSDGLVTIDLDDDSYANAFLAANPMLADTLRTRASRGCNIWLRCSGGYPPSCKLKDLSGKEVGEWRGAGSQTIISGVHPSGVPYQFVVEKPVITMCYEQIIWPPGCLVPPHATESKRVRGVGEQEVVCSSVVAVAPGAVGVSPAADCLKIQPYLANNDLVVRLVPTACHQNNNSLFKLARLVRTYESVAGRPATKGELQFVFERWAERARQFWRPELTRDDYYAEFLTAYSYAEMGLHENPLDLAVSCAKTGPLPKVPSFTDKRIRLLVAICRELQKLTCANPFYLPTRKLGEVLGAHWTQVARWLRALEVLDIIHLAPGEIRRRGGTRSPRYHYGPAIAASGALSAKTDGKASEFRYLLSEGDNGAQAGHDPEVQI